jgi:hypothetical protein
MSQSGRPWVVPDDDLEGRNESTAWSDRELRATRAAARWIFTNPLPTITLGLLLYGMLRLAYTTFYDEFGVTPEQVGLTYAETLSRSAVLVGSLIVYFMVVTLLSCSLFSQRLAASTHRLEEYQAEGARPDQPSIHRPFVHPNHV